MAKPRERFSYGDMGQPKPHRPDISIPELLDELRAQIRRKTGKPDDPEVLFLTTQIEMLSGTVPSVSDELWPGMCLTPKERRILNHFKRYPGKLISRDAVYNLLYFDYPSADLPDQKIIDVYMTKVRRQLIASDSGYWIYTRHSEGYVFVEEPAREASKKTANGQPRRFGRKFGAQARAA